MGRVGIVSPLSSVPNCKMHLEEGRGRGALSLFLLVPDDPPNAFESALHILHDPRGPADLDLRLGNLAASTPLGTSFLVVLDDQVWVFPSNEAEIRLLRQGEPELLEVPQVIRLDPEDRIEVIAVRTGEAVALASYVHAPSTTTAPRSSPVHDLPSQKTRVVGELLGQVRRRFVDWRSPAWSRVAAVIGGSAAFAVFLLFRVFAARPPEPPALPENRADAYVSQETQANAGSEADPKGDPATKGDASEVVASDSLVASTSGSELGEEAAKSDGDSAREETGETTLSSETAPANSGWAFQARAAITSSPLLAQGMLIFGSRDSTVYCLDARTGEKKWAFRAGSGVGSSPRAARGLVVFGTYAGRVLGVDLKSGKLQWEGRTGGKIVSSPCILEDVVVIGSNDRRVHAFRLSDGEKAWSFETKGALRSSAEPIGPDRVAIGSTDGTVYAIDTKKGQKVWARAAGSSILAAGAFDAEEEALYVGTQGGQLLCLEAATGTVRWRSSLGSALHARPRLAEGRVVVGTSSGSLLALSASSGKTLWKTSGRGKRGFDATPAVLENLVYAPSFDGTMHVVGLEDGNVKGTRPLGAQVWSSPVAAEDLVYVGTFAGKLLALAVP